MSDAASQAEGAWTAQVADSGGFVVVRADSYPELLNPPPSVAESPASVRYYPEGKTPLLIARGVGPAAGEPLFYNGQTPMQAFGQGDLRFLAPAERSRALCGCNWARTSSRYSWCAASAWSRGRAAQRRGDLPGDGAATGAWTTAACGWR